MAPKTLADKYSKHITHVYNLSKLINEGTVDISKNVNENNMTDWCIAIKNISTQIVEVASEIYDEINPELTDEEKAKMIWFDPEYAKWNQQ